MKKNTEYSLSISSINKATIEKREVQIVSPDLLHRNINQRGWTTDVTDLDYAGKKSFFKYYT